MRGEKDETKSEARPMVGVSRLLVDFYLFSLRIEDKQTVTFCMTSPEG